jgi:hypothetical protein
MIGYGFSLGAGETGSEGALRVDNLHLSSGTAPPLVIPTATPTPAPAAPSETPIEESVEEPGPEDEKEPEGGICRGAAVLPLGAIGILLASQRRRGDRG